MTNKIPSGAEKNHESTEPESSKTAKLVFFLQTGQLNLRELLTVIQAQNSSILYGAVHNPIAFAYRSHARRSHLIIKLWLPLRHPIFIYMAHAHFWITQQRPEINYSRSLNQKYSSCMYVPGRGIEELVYAIAISGINFSSCFPTYPLAYNCVPACPSIVYFRHNPTQYTYLVSHCSELAKVPT